MPKLQLNGDNLNAADAMPSLLIAPTKLLGYLTLSGLVSELLRYGRLRP